MGEVAVDCLLTTARISVQHRDARAVHPNVQGTESGTYPYVPRSSCCHAVTWSSSKEVVQPVSHQSGHLWWSVAGGRCASFLQMEIPCVKAQHPSE